jgi:hypothetical protein
MVFEKYATIPAPKTAHVGKERVFGSTKFLRVKFQTGRPKKHKFERTSNIISQQQPKQHKMLSTQLNTYRYDSNTQQWAVATASSTSIDAGTKLRVATLNILHDRYYFPWQAIVRSQERYTHLIKELKTLQADIVGLNEVTVSGLSYILGKKI